MSHVQLRFGGYPLGKPGERISPVLLEEIPPQSSETVK